MYTVYIPPNPNPYIHYLCFLYSEYLVKELLPGPETSRSVKGCQNHSQWSQGHHDKHSPDSACSVDYSSSRRSSPDSQQQPPGESETHAHRGIGS